MVDSIFCTIFVRYGHEDQINWLKGGFDGVGKSRWQNVEPKQERERERESRSNRIEPIDERSSNRTIEESEHKHKWIVVVCECVR